MKAKFGMIVTQGSGKIGGHVASRNRAGAYFRTKVTPINPQTTNQQNARARLTTFSQAWRGLTQAARDAWNSVVSDFARTDIFGDLRNPTGFNLYQRLNNNLQIVGAATIDTPPVPQAVDTVQIGALVADVGVGDAITIATSGAVPANTAMQVWATPGQSPGKNFVKSEYRLIEVFEATDTSPHDIQTSYIARFGDPAAGQKVFVRIVFVNTNTGQVSTPQEASTIVIESA